MIIKYLLRSTGGAVRSISWGNEALGQLSFKIPFDKTNMGNYRRSYSKYQISVRHFLSTSFNSSLQLYCQNIHLCHFQLTFPFHIFTSHCTQSFPLFYTSFSLLCFSLRLRFPCNFITWSYNDILFFCLLVQQNTRIWEKTK